MYNFIEGEKRLFCSWRTFGKGYFCCKSVYYPGHYFKNKHLGDFVLAKPKEKQIPACQECWSYLLQWKFYVISLCNTYCDLKYVEYLKDICSLKWFLSNVILHKLTYGFMSFQTWNAFSYLELNIKWQAVFMRGWDGKCFMSSWRKFTAENSFECLMFFLKSPVHSSVCSVNLHVSFCKQALKQLRY